MSFIQIKRIKEVDDTPAKAIASYGSFVKYVNEARKRIAARPRRNRGWSTDRVSVSRSNNAVPAIHKAIYDKFGSDVLREAVSAHPFN